MKIETKATLLGYAFLIVFFAVLIGLSYLIEFITGCSAKDAAEILGGLYVCVYFALGAYYSRKAEKHGK